MKHVRKARRILHPMRSLIPHPYPWTWTGGWAFRRAKRQKFRDLAAHLEPDEFKMFCAAVGFIEVNWAFYESQMDRWVQIAYNVLKFRHGGPHSPTGYSGKFAYLKRAFQGVAMLAPYRTRGLAVLAIGDSLSELRHNVTHGVITGIEPVDFFKFILVNRRLNRSGMHTEKEFVFDIRTFPQTGKKLVEDLGAESVQLTQELQSRFLR